MHITSLPSEYGVGDLGESAFAFVDLLEEGKVGLWQMLPLGPTGYGDSPYAARSAFAGNELMISPRSLYIDGYLDISDVMVKASPSERVDYGSAKALKMPMLRKAALALLSSKGADRKAFESFAADESWWLDDYALFQAIADEEGDSRWFSEWPKALRNRDEKAIEKKRKELKEEITGELKKIFKRNAATMFAALMVKFRNPALGVIVGALFTAPPAHAQRDRLMLFRGCAHGAQAERQRHHQAQDNGNGKERCDDIICHHVHRFPHLPVLSAPASRDVQLICRDGRTRYSCPENNLLLLPPGKHIDRTWCSLSGNGCRTVLDDHFHTASAWSAYSGSIHYEPYLGYRRSLVGIRCSGYRRSCTLHSLLSTRLKYS